MTSRDVDPATLRVDGGCPDCEHEDQANSTWLDRLLERRGAEIYRPCPWRVDPEADFCGCEHPYHSH